MAKENIRSGDGKERDMTNNREEGFSSIPNDLPDSPRDEEHLQPEETTMDLPEVKDIPGQEFVHATPLGEMADTTASSDDEEGKRIFEEDNDEGDVQYVMGTKADVSRDEQIALNDITYMPTTDENNLRDARMDDDDFQGAVLNEGSFGDERSGRDLDVPGAELDDRNENIGEEDEENNDYSLGSADNDNVTEGTP